jgi:predicted MFS family arabinose efflux permease
MNNKIRSESFILLVLAATQFINILDFMMVMPMGPDFAAALGIPTAKLGIIGGSYTFSAALSGLIGAFILDRFDRKRALIFCLVGLLVGTAAGGFAWDFHSLVGTRILAGFFGGPASALVLSIISDIIPPARRGKALGLVMASFSLASIFGIPAGLEMARLGGWRTPFFGVAAFGVLIAIGAQIFLPNIRAHLDQLKQMDANHKKSSLLTVLRRPYTITAILMMMLIMIGAFVLIPNMSAYLQFNLGYPREYLGLLYFVGGILSLGGMQLAGYLTDRFGSSKVYLGISIGFVLIIVEGFINVSTLFPPIIVFPLFMLFSSARMVSVSALTTKIPLPEERARFQSLQSTGQHIACAFGSFLGAAILVEGEGHKLQGIPTASSVTIFMTLITLVMCFWIEKNLRKIS